MQFNIFEEEIGEINDNRYMKIPTQTFGILRKQLVKNLGAERSQDLLFNFGYEMGATDVKKLIDSGVEKADLVKKGPILHIENGQIEGIIHQCEAKFDENNQLMNIVGQGEWIGSYEAIQHLNWFGPSNKTVCYTLTGYASGFMSGAFDDQLIAKELTCKAKGDPSCTWIIKTQRQWEMETGDHFLIQSSTIERELKDTYDQLIEQRDFIKRLFDFQKLISDELLKGNTIEQLSKLAVKFLGNPLCIQDKNLRTLVYAGLPEREYAILEEDFNTYLKENDFDNVFSSHLKVSTRPRKIETERQTRITMPIIIKEQLLGWLFFIYDKKRHTLKQDEALFLDCFANAVSMLLLNDRTKFESFERMKGNFLDQLLSNTLLEKEIYRIGLFAGIDFTKPYYVIACELKTTSCEMNEKFQVEEQLLGYYFDYFHDHQINSLIGHRDGKIVLLISDSTNESIRTILENLAANLLKTYPSVKVQFGISHQMTTPLEVAYAFKQANMALRLIFTKNIVFYEELGLISLLPKDQDIDWVRYTVKKELGLLSDYEETKTHELLKTLYVFLINGGNLDKTKNMLNLSLSGLRHRLQNIEIQLGKDIRDPEVMYHLIFMLKLLIVSEEIDFKTIK